MSLNSCQAFDDQNTMKTRKLSGDNYFFSEAYKTEELFIFTDYDSVERCLCSWQKKLAGYEEE